MSQDATLKIQGVVEPDETLEDSRGSATLVFIPFVFLMKRPPKGAVAGAH